MANYVLDTPPPVEAGLTVNDLLQVIRRRRNVGLIILGVCVLATLLYCITATRLYTSQGIVEVQREGSTGLEVTDISGAGAAGAGAGAGDAPAGPINLETQASILQSDSLALIVIHDLNLENTTDFQPHFNLIGSIVGGVKSLFTAKAPPEPPGPLENSPGRRATVVGTFKGNLSVKVVTGTRLLQISYTSRDPKLAAKVVNRLIQGLTDFSFQSRTASSTTSRDFLEAQLADLRKQSEADQQRLVAAQKNADLFSFGTDAGGHETGLLRCAGQAAAVDTGAFDGDAEPDREGSCVPGGEERRPGADLGVERNVSRRRSRGGCPGADQESAAAAGDAGAVGRGGGREVWHGVSEADRAEGAARPCQ